MASVFGYVRLHAVSVALLDVAWPRQEFSTDSGNAVRKLFPLLITLIVLSGIGWVLYQVYLSVSKIRDTASERMGKKNVVFTKDGVRVGVKDVKNEKYVDKTQSWVVKAWNLSQPQQDNDVYVLSPVY